MNDHPLVPQGPLQDALADRPELLAADNRREAEAHLEALFLDAQGGANAYRAERIQEIFELAERAVALGSAFPLPPTEERGPTAAWFRRIPDLFGKYGTGLLLAGSAPFVADDSMLLALAAGIGGVVTLASQFRSTTTTSPAKPKAVQARFKNLVSAADRALNSMTAPRALAAPSSGQTPLPPDDILAFLQDAAMAEGSEEADDLRVNAERLIQRAGYRVVREGPTELFETMLDPDVAEPLLLKPALVHRADESQVIFGVMVRGQTE